MKLNLYRPPFGNQVPNGSGNMWHMPVFCSVGHEKQGRFRQATRDVWEECVSYAWVGKWAKAFREGQALLADDPPIRKTSNSRWSRRIHIKFECEPYQSGLAMARDLGLSKTYVLEVLKNIFKLKEYSLRWVPHILNDNQNATTVEMAASMLSILERLTPHALFSVLAGNESWLYF
jgi:hypothetical protein